MTSSFIIGYIAIASSNGFITVCVIRTLISKETSAIKELQKVDIWTEDDFMEVRFMHWVKKASFSQYVSSSSCDLNLSVSNTVPSACS